MRRVSREVSPRERARDTSAGAPGRQWIHDHREAILAGRCRLRGGLRRVRACCSLSPLTPFDRAQPFSEAPMPDRRRRTLLLLAASFAVAALGACSQNPATAPGISSEILVKSAGPLGEGPPGLP